MTFLNPANLILLSLLALVAAAYWLRMPRRRLRVPDAALARLALADHSRLSRQKRTLISLVLQIAILLLLAVAAALPFLGAAHGAPRSLIVVLDTSASMRAADGVPFHVLADSESPSPPALTRFQKALLAVQGLSRDLSPRDRMMLLTVQRTVDVAFNFRSDPAGIAHALESLAPSAESANFADASRLAAQIAQAQTSAEIVLVTSGVLKGADLAPLAALKSVPVKLVQVGARSGNLGIISFHARKNLDSPTDYEALVSLLNTFDQPHKVEVELLLNDSVFDLATVNVPAGGEALQVFREKLRVGGVLEARLRVADALADDNVAWEILRAPTRLRVLLVSDDTSASSFLVRAVGSNPTAVEGMVLTPEQYRRSIAPHPEVLRDQRDAVIFDRWAPSRVEELPPVHVLAIDCVPPGMPVKAGAPFDKPLIRKWEQGHPLMSYLNLRDVFISTARQMNVLPVEKGQPPVERVAEMVTSPLVLAWERPLPAAASHSGAAPVLVRPQRFVVLGFNPRESDMVLRKELPLLLWNSFLWFQNAVEPATQVAPGETIALDATPASEAREVRITTPAGTLETAGVEAESGLAYYAATSMPGVYRYRVENTEGAFAVNCGDRNNSDVRPAVELGFQPERLDAAQLAALAPAGRAVWPYLLLAAAALLAFEAVVFHRRIYF